MPEFFTSSSINEIALELAMLSAETQAKPLPASTPLWLGFDSRGKAGAYYGTPDDSRHLVVARNASVPLLSAELLPRLQTLKALIHFDTLDERLGQPGGPGSTTWAVWRSHAPRLAFQARHAGSVPTRRNASTCDIFALPDGRVIANETVFPSGVRTLDPCRIPLEANNFTFSSKRHMELLLAEHPDSAAIQEAVVGFGLLAPRETSSHGGLRARPTRQPRLRAFA